MFRLEAGGLAEKMRAGKPARIADAVIQRAGIGARMGNESLQIACWIIRTHQHAKRVDADHGKRREVAKRIIARFTHEMRIGSVRGNGAEEDRVSIRRSTGGSACADGAIRAADILDHKVLSEDAPQTFPVEPCKAIRAAAGWKCRNDAHRAAWPIGFLTARDGGRKQRRASAKREQGTAGCIGFVLHL